VAFALQAIEHARTRLDRPDLQPRSR
jgi:hypothetical protein